MRFFILQSCTGLLLSSCVFGVDSGPQNRQNTIEDVLAETSGRSADDGTGRDSTDSDSFTGSSTTFNGIEVPPMKELTGEGFDTEIKDGYWYARTVSRCLFFRFGAIN